MPPTAVCLPFRSALLCCKNGFTQVALDYEALNATISLWDRLALANAIGSVEGAAASLADAGSLRLVPELQVVHDSATPLACTESALSQLMQINATLLTLPPSINLLFHRAAPLAAALRQIPSPTTFIQSLQNLNDALTALPSLGPYTTGVSAISAAVRGSAARVSTPTHIGKVTSRVLETSLAGCWRPH